MLYISSGFLKKKKTIFLDAVIKGFLTKISLKIGYTDWQKDRQIYMSIKITNIFNNSIKTHAARTLIIIIK